jgi:hypothetical protein
MRLKLLALALTLLTAGCAGVAGAKPTLVPLPQSMPPAGNAIKTVFLIVMENHNWSSIAGSPSAPYINHLLLPEASYATQYYNPPGNHPSLPNYLWLEAGTNCFPDTGCIRDDRDPDSHTTSSHLHLATLLNQAGISWMAYEENISGTSCPNTSSTSIGQTAATNGLPVGGLYAVRHDPFMYFHDVTDNVPYCLAHVRPFAQLAGDLRHNRVARYNFITPNICDDMHSACPFYSNRVKQGDNWLSRVIPTIQASSAYKHGGAIFITWDEGAGGDGPIGMIVLSPDARGGGYHNAIHYTHSSTVRTIEGIFHLRAWLGGAAHSNDLRDMFRRFP